MADDSERLERLKLAYGIHAARRVIGADHQQTYDEMKLYGEIFPRPLVRDHGFLDDEDRVTPAFHQAVTEALDALPSALDTQSKLDLLTLLYETANADGRVALTEVSVLRDAAQELRVPEADLFKLMQRLRLAEGG